MIQVNYRRYKFRNLGADKRQAMFDGAVIIQAFIRGCLLRIRLDDMMPSRGVQLGVKVDIPEEEASPRTSYCCENGSIYGRNSRFVGKEGVTFQVA